MIRHLGAGEVVDDLLALALAEHRPGPRVMLNMVASVDGATALRGGATALADDDDRALFQALRAAADVILVGAETVRVENYGPVRLDEAARHARRQMGLEVAPALAIVSRSLDLDPAARVFSDPGYRPLIITGEDAPAERARVLAQSAELVVAGERGADPTRIPQELASRGLSVVLAEGGPTLNGELIASDLVTEINLSLSPLAVAGHAARVSHHPRVVELDYRCQRVLAGDRMLFLRYLRES